MLNVSLSDCYCPDLPWSLFSESNQESKKYEISLNTSIRGVSSFLFITVQGLPPPLLLIYSL